MDRHTWKILQHQITLERPKAPGICQLQRPYAFGPHKASRRATWHSPSGKYHNQIDYIMARKRFRSSVNILDADGTDMETLIKTFNTAVTNTASGILGKHRPVKKPWVTADLLDLCDKRRELKKKKKDAEGVRQYRAVNQEIKKGMTKAKMNWVEEQCQDFEDCMKKNNSKTTYQLVKDLTSTKQRRTTTIQDKDGKCLTEEQDILKRWSKYCSKLYNYRATGDPEVLNVPPATDSDNYPPHPS